MTKPRILDLFCGVGGAGMGYHRAGFDVVGVDVNPQPRYPFDFVEADAMTFPLDGFDAIHASPPCQAYSSATTGATKALSPELIHATRRRLDEAGVPWVMENVMGAKAALRASLKLCGSMFDLPVVRHRLFETPLLLWAPEHDCARVVEARRRVPIPAHWHDRPKGAYTDRAYSVTGKSRGSGCIPFWRECMGMPWAQTARELSEAIPPAYTEWIGRQLIAAL